MKTENNKGYGLVGDMIQDTLFMVLGATSCPNTDKVGQCKVLYCGLSSPGNCLYKLRPPI